MVKSHFNYLQSPNWYFSIARKIKRNRSFILSESTKVPKIEFSLSLDRVDYMTFTIFRVTIGRSLAVGRLGGRCGFKYGANEGMFAFHVSQTGACLIN